MPHAARDEELAGPLGRERDLLDDAVGGRSGARVVQDGQRLATDQGVAVILLLVQPPPLARARSDAPRVAVDDRVAPERRLTRKHLEDPATVVDVVHGGMDHDPIDHRCDRATRRGDRLDVRQRRQHRVVERRVLQSGVAHRCVQRWRMVHGRHVLHLFGQITLAPCLLTSSAAGRAARPSPRAVPWPSPAMRHPAPKGTRTPSGC